MKIVGNGKMASLRMALFASAAALCGSQPAWSQDAVAQVADDAAAASIVAEPSPDPEAESEIVVTGTLIRGIAPVGTNVLGVSSEAITRSGAVNAQQLLAQIPQVSNFFNGTPSASSDFTFPTTTPVIRNLPGINSTLTLLNGHRLVNIGILQAAGDPGVLPVSVMERVEVVPDGGSATYGSDAVGGTINFITRRRFDGLQIDGSYGIADNYRQKYISAIGGKDWGTGSAYIAYAYADNDAIFGRDRDYISQFRDDRGGSDFRSSACAAPNVIAGGISYALPGFTPGANRCDTSDNSSTFPAQKRHSVYAYLTQQLSDTIRFEDEVVFSRTFTDSFRPQVQSTVTIDARNPFFRPVAGETVQTVQFAYDPVWGPNRLTSTTTASWGTAPKFTFSLPGTWRLQVSGNYGRGYARVNERTSDVLAQSAALIATSRGAALNPYDLAQTNPAVLDAIHDFENYAQSTTELFEGRAVLDGALAALPGGDLRLAVGTEYHAESMKVRNIGAPLGLGQSSQSFFGSRNVVSVFGEAVLPLFGEENGFAGMRRLTLSAAARYDRYNDVGDTVNPKIGATWVPIDGLTIRGNYGTSFNAPQLGDSTAASDTRAQVFNNSFNIGPGATAADAQRRTVLIAGGNVDLKPQTADTFSVGADIRPAAIPGLTISGTYYYVKFKNLISITPVFGSEIYLPGFEQFITVNPTLAQARDRLAGFRLDGIASIDDLFANGQSPYLIADARRYNLGLQRTQGIDYNIAYDRDTDFGSINLSVAGSYTLVRDSQPFEGGARSDVFDAGAPRLSLVGTAGATVGSLTGQVQYIRTDGYDLGNNPLQDRVGAFDPVNLFLSCDLPAGLFLSDTSLTLNVQNLFDRDPPFFNGGSGFTNGNTYGRLFILGLRKKI